VYGCLCSYVALWAYEFNKFITPNTFGVTNFLAGAGLPWCSIEEQKGFHFKIWIAVCSYLLHKFAINCFFDNSVYFIRITDCSIRVFRLLQGLTCNSMHTKHSQQNVLLVVFWTLTICYISQINV